VATLSVEPGEQGIGCCRCAGGPGLPQVGWQICAWSHKGPRDWLGAGIPAAGMGRPAPGFRRARSSCRVVISYSLSWLFKGWFAPGLFAAPGIGRLGDGVRSRFAGGRVTSSITPGGMSRREQRRRRKISGLGDPFDGHPRTLQHFDKNLISRSCRNAVRVWSRFGCRGSVREIAIIESSTMADRVCAGGGSRAVIMESAIATDERVWRWLGAMEGGNRRRARIGPSAPPSRAILIRPGRPKRRKRVVTARVVAGF